jgi:hypothetical protein
MHTAASAANTRHKGTHMKTKYTDESLDAAHISSYELENQYKEMLSECYGEIDICGIKYDAAEALESVDPVAFRCGFADYISAELDDNLIEMDGEYYKIDLLEEIEEEA